MRADYTPEYSRQASTCSASPETSGIARKRRDLPQQVGRLGRLAEPDPVTGTDIYVKTHGETPESCRIDQVMPERGVQPAQPDTGPLAPFSRPIGGHMIRATTHGFRAGEVIPVDKYGTPLDPNIEIVNGKAKIRQFSTGATRDTDAGKLDFDGFLSPLVLRRYADYMHGHRKLPDGSLRASDNWSLGIDREVYMKSLWRHFFAVWEENKGIETPDGLVANLCAVLFNASGMLHEVLKAQNDHTPGAGYAMPLADKGD